MKASTRVLRPTSAPAAATRERILDAAEKLFAARGFRRTSVREITSAARCNLAAVNYHFGGKSALYREMFHRRLRKLREMRIRGINEALRTAGEKADIETLLRAFTSTFLEPHIEGGDGRVLMKLFTHEIFDPHLPPSMVRREIIEPVQGAMTAAFVKIGIRLEGRSARRCVQSVVAQLIHVVQMHALARETEWANLGDFGFHGIVDHIVHFSAAGIRAAAGARE